MSLGSQHLVDVSPHIPVLLWNEICHGKWHKDVLENPLSSTTSSAKQWAVISTVYSISHRQFPELTAILFWCSTKLPVLPYSPLVSMLYSPAFFNSHKADQRLPKQGLCLNVYTTNPKPIWGSNRPSVVEHLRAKLSVCTYIGSDVNESTRQILLHDSRASSHVYIWNVLASWFSNTFESQNTIFAIISENDQQMAQDQTYLRSTSCFIFSS